ncbi:MAG: nitrate reductase [Gammaproteobacteria bacterium]|nr:nitrate reductase [Gammaproteobacteria bacterium]
MDIVSLVFFIAFYGCAGVFIVGLAARIWRYARTPAPLKIPTMPAPRTHLGVCWRLSKELLFFESLFKASKWTWLFGWVFHAALCVVLLKHLRYFTEPIWQPVIAIQGFASGAAIAMAVALLGLWLRRVLVDRVRYISTLSDHLMLALLLAICASGLVMRYVAPPNIGGLTTFTLGLVEFEPKALPGDAWLILHLLLVLLLIAVFPFSKLVHAPALLFSPTRYQKDDGRH